MTSSDWELRSDTGELSWQPATLEAFNTLFPDVIGYASLLPAEFTEVFLDLLTFFTDADGSISSDDAKHLIMILGLWRAQMDAIQQVIDRRTRSD